LFDLWRFHAFCTTTEPAVLDTVAADTTHWHHAIIEQAHAGLTISSRAHRETRLGRLIPPPRKRAACVDLLRLSTALGGGEGVVLGSGARRWCPDWRPDPQR